MTQRTIIESSFRDPDGFVFFEDKKLLRQVNVSYKEDYDFLISSSLYDKLTKEGLLIRHREIGDHPGYNSLCYKIIEPEKVEILSCPYEWSFSQLKDAALLTLKIQQTALQYGMILKDGTAFNIQFHKGRPVFIDTLSFTIYREGRPWEAYRQFCQHFLAPLALMAHTDIRTGQFMTVYTDGIPLDIASKILPFRTKINFSLLMHVHLHANSQKKHAGNGAQVKNAHIKKSHLVALMDSLIHAVQKVNIEKEHSLFLNSIDPGDYTERSLSHIKEIIERHLTGISPLTLWDLGAGTGEFSRVAGRKNINCIAFDIDPLAVDMNYNLNKKENITNVLPLVMDPANPTPCIGWNNEERPGFRKRPEPDLVLAFGLIHRLAIGNNLPFNKIAKFFSGFSKDLIIEFIPKSASSVKKLLQSREDIFYFYNEEFFIKEFQIFYTIQKSEPVIGSESVVYWMRRK